MDRYFYSVEMDGDNKVVHMFGNVYFNGIDETGACYRHAEWTGLYLSVKEVRNLFDEFCFYDYICDKVSYLGDLTEDEMIEVCRTYFNGESGKMLHVTQVNEDTPCGDYWFD